MLVAHRVSFGVRVNGRNRRSAAARDPTDGLPLTLREQSFALRLSDGKVCHTAAVCRSGGAARVMEVDDHAHAADCRKPPVLDEAISPGCIEPEMREHLMSQLSQMRITPMTGIRQIVDDLRFDMRGALS